jgi:hypothetical protein
MVLIFKNNTVSILNLNYSFIRTLGYGWVQSDVVPLYCNTNTYTSKYARAHTCNIMTYVNKSLKT